MKGLFLVIVIALAAIQGYAQMAIINDPDGFVYVRAAKNSKSEIVGKIFTGEVFWTYPYESETDWWECSFSEKETFGFIHKSKIRLLEQLKHIPVKPANRRQNSNTLSISNDTLKFIITIKPFKADEHQINKIEDKFVVKIDGTEPIGTDGEVPKMEIVNFSLNFKNQSVPVPKTEYQDLFEPYLQGLNIYAGDKGFWYIYMPGNSDGAGGYYAAWIFKKNKYRKRVIMKP